MVLCGALKVRSGRGLGYPSCFGTRSIRSHAMAGIRDGREQHGKSMICGNRRTDVKKKKSWKHILEYELGVLILVAVLLVAWFGPDLYASWQDQSQNGKVVCSSRDEASGSWILDSGYCRQGDTAAGCDVSELV